MSSVFSDSLIASGGWFHSPEIARTIKGITMKFLLDVGIYKEASHEVPLLYMNEGIDLRNAFHF